MASTFLSDSDTTWTRYLDRRYHEAELSALTDETVLELGSYLDIRIYSLDNNRYSDYTGLADLIGLNFGFVEPLRYETKQAFKVIREWQNGQSTKETPTVGHLVRALIRLNRGDVVAECRLNISRDVEQYLANPQELTPGIRRPSDTPILTTDDLPGRPAINDAYIIYNEDSDQCECFVNEIIQKLESSPFHLRFYFPKRSGLFGVMKLDNFTRVLEKRCKHVIVILSPEYHNCEVSSFLTSMAIVLSNRDRSRRIVPVFTNGYQENQVPDVLRMQTAWNFSGQQDPLQWRRMALSVCRFTNGNDVYVDQ